MEGAVLQWVSTYGYFAIFGLLVFGIVGLPVPDEFLLTSCGVLAYQGHLSLAPTLLAGVLGSISGITCSYTIGRTLGWKVLHTRLARFVHITDKEIDRIHDWFHRIGHWALIIGYFVPGIRHFTAIVAGTSKLEWPSFALFAYSGAILWVSTFVFIGYHFGPEFRKILAVVDQNLKIASIAAAVLIASYLLWRFWWKKRTA